MTFHKGKKSRKVVRKRNLSEYQLIHHHIDAYKHLLSVGYAHTDIVKHLRKSTKGESSAEKLYFRITSAYESPGVQGVSLEGIRVTEPVKVYIRHLETEHIIEPYHKGQSSLRFVGKPAFPWLK